MAEKKTSRSQKREGSSKPPKEEESATPGRKEPKGDKGDTLFGSTEGAPEFEQRTSEEIRQKELLAEQRVAKRKRLLEAKPISIVPLGKELSDLPNPGAGGRELSPAFRRRAKPAMIVLPEGATAAEAAEIIKKWAEGRQIKRPASESKEIEKSKDK